MINAVAIVKVKSGMRDAFLDAFHENARVARSLPGCIAYGVGIDMQGGPPFQTLCGEDGLVIQEVWADMQSLSSHASGAHMKEFGARTKGMVESRAIYLLEPQ